MKQWMKTMKPVDIIRRVTQLLSFLIVPGLFTSVFYGIKEIYTSMIGGTITASTVSSQIFLLIATILSTILLGRFFCGFFCSFGAMGDLIWFISKKTVKPHFKISEKVDEKLKYLKYAVLLFIVVGIWTLNLVTWDSTSNPWNIFGMYSSISGFSTLGYLFSIGGLLLLLIIIGSFFIERFFCRYLCPLGAIFAVFSKMRLFNIKKNRSQCGSCRACTNQCSMGIPLYRYDRVTSGECINCFECISHCPRGNAKVNPSPAVASTASVIAISSLLYMGNIASASTLDTSNSSTQATQSESGNYTDGTYTGSGTGFRGETTVSVTVENGYITDITVLSYEDDRKYFERAESAILSDIIESQDVNVDTVSGATFSSNGIIAAVAEALSGAEASDTTVSNTTTTSETTATNSSEETTSIDTAQATPTEEPASTSNTTAPNSSEETVSTDTTQVTPTESASSEQTSSEQTYTDGTYIGTGTGFRGDTEVSVTVSDGKITDITVTSYVDDEQFFSRAVDSVISEIITSQDVNVDAVSGATFSSNGIMEAVANAIGVEFTNPNSTLSRGGHGGPGGH